MPGHFLSAIARIKQKRGLEIKSKEVFFGNLEGGVSDDVVKIAKSF